MSALCCVTYCASFAHSRWIFIFIAGFVLIILYCFLLNRALRIIYALSLTRPLDMKLPEGLWGLKHGPLSGFQSLLTNPNFIFDKMGLEVWFQCHILHGRRLSGRRPKLRIYVIYQPNQDTFKRTDPPNWMSSKRTNTEKCGPSKLKQTPLPLL